MDPTINTRRYHRVLPPALAILIAGLTAGPLFAQAERYAVLVPIFQNTAGQKGNFGKDAAKETIKLLEDFPTHKPVEEKTLKDALKQFGVKEEALGENGCVQGQQMTTHVDAQLVLCGTWEELDRDTYRVEAEVIAPGSDSYAMAPFQAADPKDAAQKIMEQFEEYMEGLRVAVYCQDYIGTENWPSAVENCRRAIEMNPASRSATYNLASALWKTGDLDGAKAMFMKVLELDPINEDALLSLGVLAAEMQNTEEAMKHFRDYLTLNPGDVDVRITIATDAAQAGGNEAALQIVEDGMPDATGDDLLRLQEFAGAFAMNAALRQMEASGDMSQVGEARPIVERGLGYLEQVFASKGEATDVTALKNMLTAYRLLEQYEKATDFGRQAVTHYPDDPALWSTYADALNRADMNDEALAALDRIEQIDPNYSLLHARRALWRLATGNLDGAVTAVETGLQAQQIEPTQADQIAQQITSMGFNDRAQKNQHQAALRYYATAEKVAQTSATRSMIAFFKAYSMYQQAAEAEKPETLATARATLPQFQAVLALLRQASEYTQSPAGGRLEANRQQLIEGTNQYIQIQQAIIKRGR